jgi:hypothetical protein
VGVRRYCTRSRETRFDFAVVKQVQYIAALSQNRVNVVGPNVWILSLPDYPKINYVTLLNEDQEYR